MVFLLCTPFEGVVLVEVFNEEWSPLMMGKSPLVNNKRHNPYMNCRISMDFEVNKSK